MCIRDRPGAIDKISIRGARSMTAGANPLVVIDGIVYTSMQNIPPEMIEELTVLSASEGTAIYRSRAADGVIVIKTKAKSSRTQFRDYAFWVPNFFTDKAGKGAIKIAYPDNVTGWKTFVPVSYTHLDVYKRQGYTCAVSTKNKNRSPCRGL